MVRQYKNNAVGELTELMILTSFVTSYFFLVLQPKLSMAKCRRNVENFLDACRKLGIPEVI